MPEVFADTFYWIALLNPVDRWHQQARAFSQTNPELSLVTTDAVLTEMLNYFSEAGLRMRQAAATLCDQTMRTQIQSCCRRLEKCLPAGSICIRRVQTKAIV